MIKRAKRAAVILLAAALLLFAPVSGGARTAIWADGVTEQMNTAGYWASRCASPDSVRLTLAQIRDINRDIAAQ